MNEELGAEIMNCLAKTMPQINPAFWNEFTSMPADELPFLHFSLGLYLRNYVLMPESALYKLFLLSGVGHKDDMSSMIIRQWHKTLNGRRDAGCSGQEQLQNEKGDKEMETTGIIRKIDELGRIVLPIEARKLFDLKEKDSVEILTDEGGIYLKPHDTERCVFCTENVELIPHGNKYICGTCLAKINERAEAALVDDSAK